MSSVWHNIIPGSSSIRHRARRRQILGGVNGFCDVIAYAAVRNVKHARRKSCWVAGIISRSAIARRRGARSRHRKRYGSVIASAAARIVMYACANPARHLGIISHVSICCCTYMARHAVPALLCFAYRKYIYVRSRPQLLISSSSMNLRKIETHPKLETSSSHTFTFQLLDKPWPQVSSLLPPGSCLQLFSRIGFSSPLLVDFY